MEPATLVAAKGRPESKTVCGEPPGCCDISWFNTVKGLLGAASASTRSKIPHRLSEVTGRSTVGFAGIAANVSLSKC